jgi:23S rRNA (pseudouridine1915-N3)-methyltransferase
VKLLVVKVGRVAYPEYRALVDVYAKRLKGFAQIEGREVKTEAELLRIVREPAGEHPLVLLDEHGTQLTSPGLADRLRRYTDDPGVKSLTFVVGDPMGHSPELKKRAQMTWGLSAGTLTSDMAWLFCWEQLYRAYNIIKGTSYHHE